MVTHDDDDDDDDVVVVVNYGVTTPDYNHNVGADYDIENDALIMLLSHLF